MITLTIGLLLGAIAGYGAYRVRLHRRRQAAAARRRLLARMRRHSGSGKVPAWLAERCSDGQLVARLQTAGFPQDTQ